MSRHWVNTPLRARKRRNTAAHRARQRRGDVVRAVPLTRRQLDCLESEGYLRPADRGKPEAEVLAVLALFADHLA